MHAFDHLIALANLRGVLDLHCQLQGNWALDHPVLPAGQASYHVILEGECRLELPGQPAMPLQAGDVVLLPRSAVHVLAAGDAGRMETSALRKIAEPGRITQLRNGNGSDGLNMLCGRIDYLPGATLLAALPEVLVINASEQPQRERLEALVSLMRLEAEGGQLANQSIVDGLSLILFTVVLRHVCEQQPELAGVFALLRDKRLAKAAQALLANLEKAWTVESMAACANMSRSNFVRAFTSSTGVAPAAWLMQLRIERAELLLKRSAASIGDIAQAVGYPTPSSFSRIFKQQTGETPAQYRHRVTTASRQQ